MKGSAALIRKAGVGIPQIYTTFVCTVQYLSPERLVFTTKLLPKFHTCRGRLPGLSASHFATDCENAEESTSSLNSSLVAQTTEGLNPSAAAATLPHQKLISKIRGKIRKFANMKSICRAEKSSLRLWDGAGQFHGMMNANKLAGPNCWCISASFQSIHCTQTLYPYKLRR